MSGQGRANYVRGNQWYSKKFHDFGLFWCEGRIYRNLKLSQSGRSTTCRAAPPNSKCKIVCVSRCGEAMRWEYPICPEIEFSSLVVLRPYVSLSTWLSPPIYPSLTPHAFFLREPEFCRALSWGAFARWRRSSK